MPRDFPDCKCDHMKGLHHKRHCWAAPVIYGPETRFSCPCTRYRPAPRKTRTSKRRIVAFAKEAERWVADELDGIRLPAIGDQSRPDVVRYGADGNELLYIECKHHPLAKFIEASVAQAEHAARGRPAPQPFAAAVHIDKPGPGHEREGFVILRVRTLAALLRRLEGE